MANYRGFRPTIKVSSNFSVFCLIDDSYRMSKRILAVLFLPLVLGDTHIDKKVSVKEVVFDSPVADMVWLEPENRIVMARTHNGMKPKK